MTIGYNNMLSVAFGLLFINCADVSTQATETVVCGKASTLFEECFKNNSQTTLGNSIPHTLEGITHRCSVFNQGMKCFHDYTNKCLDVQTKRLLENEVYGAKNFYNMLCIDRDFKRDYLRHKDCFQHIIKDLDKCSNDFRAILKEELKKNQRNEKANLNIQYMHFCCARHAYEQCVFTAAKYMCKPASAIFTRQVAELLSSEHKFKYCDRLEYYICSGAFKSFQSNVLLLFLLVASILGLGL